MMKRLLAVLAVAVLFLAGCGDDEKADPPASPAATTEDTEPTTTEAPEGLALDDWVEQADEICAEATEQTEDLGEPADIDEIIEMFPDALDINEDEIAQLEELGLPDEMADEAEELLELRTQQVAMLSDAFDELESSDDPEAVLEDMSVESDEMQADMEELAEELGLEECGISGGGSTDDTTPDDTGGTSEPFTYGDDAVLDGLWDDCEGGDGAACDELYRDSPIGSEYEDFGNTCGGLFGDDEIPASCEVELGGGTGGSSDEAFTYGDDAELDALWDACEDGNGAACDELFWGSPVDSEYETFGNTCGGLFAEDEVPLSCEEEIGGEKIITDDDIGVSGSSYGDDPVLDALYDACADGDMTACDDLFWDSPIDSEYEDFGQTCGGLFTEADAPFSCAEGE